MRKHPNMCGWEQTRYIWGNKVCGVLRVKSAGRKVARNEAGSRMAPKRE